MSRIYISPYSTTTLYCIVSAHRWFRLQSAPQACASKLRLGDEALEGEAVRVLVDLATGRARVKGRVRVGDRERLGLGLGLGIGMEVGLDARLVDLRDRSHTREHLYGKV